MAAHPYRRMVVGAFMQQRVGGAAAPCEAFSRSAHLSITQGSSTFVVRKNGRPAAQLTHKGSLTRSTDRNARHTPGLGRTPR
jgi:hypothetical protein